MKIHPLLTLPLFQSSLSFYFCLFYFLFFLIHVVPKLAIKLIYIRSPWAGSCNKFNNIKKIVQYIPTVQYIIVNKIKRVVAYLISDSVVLNTKEDILKSVGKRNHFQTLWRQWLQVSNVHCK